MRKPALNSTLFWDTDENHIDWDKNANVILVRVLERGSLEDFREIRKVYGDKKIKEAALSARYLSERTLSFAAFFFELPITEFECYRNKQYHIPHLNF